MIETDLQPNEHGIINMPHAECKREEKPTLILKRSFDPRIFFGDCPACRQRVAVKVREHGQIDDGGSGEGEGRTEDNGMAQQQEPEVGVCQEEGEPTAGNQHQEPAQIPGR